VRVNILILSFSMARNGITRYGPYGCMPTTQDYRLIAALPQHGYVISYEFRSSFSSAFTCKIYNQEASPRTKNIKESVMW
jgi:hypothetical protein